MRFVLTHFMRGVPPKNMRKSGAFDYAVKDPPVAGCTHVFILGDGKKLTLFHPFTLLAYTVPDDCEEILMAKEQEYLPDEMANIILTKWDTYKKLEMHRDYTAAAAVLLELGYEPPEEKIMAKKEDGDKEKRRGGKPLETERFKPVKAKGRRGQVVQYFLDGQQKSIHTAQAQLQSSRSALLSHLFCIWRDHGLGYEVDRDSVVMLFPEPRPAIFDDDQSAPNADELLGDDESEDLL